MQKKIPLYVENIESKHTLIDKLCNCKHGNTLLNGYEQKNFYIIRYSSSVDYVSSCFGIGIMCQCKLNYINNIIFNEIENSLVIFFDNILVKYILGNKEIIKKYDIITMSYIFHVRQVKEKIIIVHEIGVIIIDNKDGSIIKNYNTDIIVDYEFKHNFLEVFDMSGTALNIEIY